MQGHYVQKDNFHYLIKILTFFFSLLGVHTLYELTYHILLDDLKLVSLKSLGVIFKSLNTK